MESNWRFNVAKAGLTGLGIEMCSRSLLSPAYYVCKYTAFQSFAYGLWFIPYPDSDPMFAGFQPTNGRHFPYGVAVEPD